MRRSMTYGLLVLFMLFLITANPSSTGQSGRDFITWLSSGWDDTRAFVTSLLEEDDLPGEVSDTDVAPAVDAVVRPTPTPLPIVEADPELAPPADPGVASELGTIE